LALFVLLLSNLAIDQNHVIAPWLVIYFNDCHIAEKNVMKRICEKSCQYINLSFLWSSWVI
ncbi:hypothetical protein, partial [Bacillus sp. ISL-55]|uniref:hypothetical protein n=1 Tax=Bacillus sp. ISL-55 TaxID=2819134 RepID=UPI001BE61937